MKTNQSLTTTNFIGYAQEEYENLKPLIEITKAFVRSSNQYIYIIDFLKKDSYTYPIKSSGSVEKK